MNSSWLHELDTIEKMTTLDGMWKKFRDSKGLLAPPFSVLHHNRPGSSNAQAYMPRVPISAFAKFRCVFFCAFSCRQKINLPAFLQLHKFYKLSIMCVCQESADMC